MLTERNTTKTPHPSGRAATLRMPSGSFASSTSCRIYSSGGWIRVIRRRKSTSISFPRNVRLWSCGKSRSLSVFNRTNPLADIVLPQAIPARVTQRLTSRFVSFIAGSFAAVLLVASLLDPDLFLHFEITPHRTVLFYLGVFGGILAVSRGMIPAENLVFDPEASLREVVRWTHYLPEGWEGRLHSQAVRSSRCAPREASSR